MALTILYKIIRPVRTGTWHVNVSVNASSTQLSTGGHVCQLVASGLSVSEANIVILTKVRQHLSVRYQYRGVLFFFVLFVSVCRR